MRILAISLPVLVLAGMLGACSAEDDSTDESTDLAKPGGGSTCGNGTIDGREQCDGSNLGGGTCASATRGRKPVGTLSCTNRCKYDTMGCTMDGTGGSGGAGG